MARSRSKLVGLEAAKRFLAEYPDAVEKRVLRNATRAAARVIAKAVKERAPRDLEGQSPASAEYGRLRSNIGVRNASRLPKGVVGHVVTTRKGFWGYFLEFGTGPFYSGQGSRSAGAGYKKPHNPIRPQPWYRPAVDTSTRAAANASVAGIAKGLDREAKRLARKHRARSKRK